MEIMYQYLAQKLLLDKIKGDNICTADRLIIDVIMPDTNEDKKIMGVAENIYDVEIDTDILVILNLMDVLSID